MEGSLRRALLRYGAAILAVILAFVVLKIPVLRDGIGTPILVAFFAIFLSAWYGGFGPGLLTVGLIGLVTASPMDGPERLVRHALFLASGAIISWLLGSLHAARRRVEDGAADLRRSEARHRQLIESMTDHAIFTTDANERVTSWSPGAERILGFRESEVLGHEPTFFVHPDASPTSGGRANSFASMLLDGARAFEGDRWCVRKDGTPFCTSTSVTPLLRDGSPGSTWVLRDVTERNRAEDELRAARDAAEAANRTKDQFLAALSHELRTPLTPALLSVAGLIEDAGTPAAIRPALEDIRRNIGLEARLIDDLLDVTRISQGKMRLSREVVDAHQLVLRAVEICRDEIVAADLDLELDLAATEHQVTADPARFQQIAWNLIKNAVKFTPRPGRVVIRSRNHERAVVAGPDTPGWLVIEVSDTGIGIEAHALGSIFRAFEQGSGGDSSQFGGLGLGLAISRTLAEAHGGRLVAASPGRDQGATFTLELPTAAARPGPSTPAPPPAQSPTASLRILLVEDNSDTLRVLTRLLKSRGYKVSTADCMTAALAEAGREPFDLLVSDIGLPDGSGLELMRTLRAERPLPGIALSGFGMDDDLRRSREAGFAAHLTKPIDFSSLEQAIQQIVPRP